MTKLDPHALRPNWQPFIKRCPLGHITSKELSKVLSVSLQTINNWKMRELLPAPDQHPRLKGNKNYFQIAKIRAWIEDRPADEIIMEWARNQIAPDIKNVEQVKWAVTVGRKAYGVERIVLV